MPVGTQPASAKNRILLLTSNQLFLNHAPNSLSYLLISRLITFSFPGRQVFIGVLKYETYGVALFSFSILSPFVNIEQGNFLQQLFRFSYGNFFDGLKLQIFIYHHGKVARYRWEFRQTRETLFFTNCDLSKQVAPVEVSKKILRS